jgi:hypothetical protein
MVHELMQRLQPHEGGICSKRARSTCAEAAAVLTRAVLWCCLQIIDAIYEQDPNGATLAFADMMKKQIVMPAHLMDDGHHETTNKGRNLFAVSLECACPCA